MTADYIPSRAMKVAKDRQEAKIKLRGKQEKLIDKVSDAISEKARNSYSNL